MSEEHDERTQVEAAQRDPSRFADLYERNFYRVYAYIVRRVGDRHQAEDLTADVFREALAGLAKFEWRGVPFAAWLVGIASRVVAGLLEALRPGDRLSGEGSQSRRSRRNRTQHHAVPVGGPASGSAVPGDSHALRGAEKHPGDCPGTRAERGRGEA